MTEKNNEYTVNLENLSPEQKDLFLNHIIGSQPLPAKSAGELVMEFHQTYGQPIRTKPELHIPEKELRFNLIKEEFEEYEEALAENDFVEVADALADMIYVIYGAAITHGIDLDDVLKEVQRSNMSKLGEDGKPIWREDGKILKGPNFSEPDIAKVLKNQGWEK